MESERQFQQIMLSKYEALLSLPVDASTECTDIRFFRTGEMLSERFLTAIFMGLPELQGGTGPQSRNPFPATCREEMLCADYEEVKGRLLTDERILKYLR